MLYDRTQITRLFKLYPRNPGPIISRRRFLAPFVVIKLPQLSLQWFILIKSFHKGQFTKGSKQPASYICTIYPYRLRVVSGFCFVSQTGTCSQLVSNGLLKQYFLYLSIYL